MAWPVDFGWLSLFAEYLIKSTLALTLALILVVLFRKRSASLRHFVLSLSLAGLLLLPVLPYLGIGWETSLLPARTSAASVSLTAPTNEIPDRKTSGRMVRGDVFLLPPGSSGALEMPAYSGQLENVSAPFIKAALPFVWSAGLIILLLRLAAGLLGAFRLTREGETVRDPSWRVLLERFLATIDLQRKVRLKSHHDVLIPLTWGFIKPVVLIPDGHEAWTEEQRSSALIHELSHVKRADFLVMVLVRLSLAVFWFNPLSWVVFRRLKNEQEEACDELVLRTGVKPSTYAANLLFFKSAAGSRLSYFAALLGLFGYGKSAFNERLAAILKQKWTFQEVKMKTKILLFCAVILAVALIGLAHPSTPVAEQTEAAMGSFTTAGPNVFEKNCPPASPEMQTAEQGQEQRQTEEKKDKEKKQEEQAQAQEEQKQKEEKKQPVVVTIKEGGKHRHKIIITEGDKVKTIMVDKPIIIKEGPEGRVFIVTLDGKELKVLGEPAHLEFKADKLEFIKEGNILKVDKDGGAVYVIAKPAVDASEAVTAIDVSEAVKAVDVAMPQITWVAKAQGSEVREKLKRVKEEKLDLKEVEEALAELEAELDKAGKEISAVALKVKDKPEVFTVVQTKGDEEAVAEIKVDIAESPRKDSITVVADKKGSFAFYCNIGAGEKGREAYEKIVARVKKDLPEGFTLDPEFEEESGLITLKISGPIDKGAPVDLVKKISGSIRDEMKEKKQ